MIVRVLVPLLAGCLFRTDVLCGTSSFRSASLTTQATSCGGLPTPVAPPGTTGCRDWANTLWQTVFAPQYIVGNFTENAFGGDCVIDSL